jgi:outer membrane protein assembly factor BamB
LPAIWPGLLWLGLLSSAWAQFPGDRGAATDGDDNVFFPADRTSLQRLAKAEELLADQRFDEAIRFLDEILQAPEDFFFRRSQAQRTYRSLRTEAQRILGTLPPRGRESYELQFGAQARKLLEQAAEAGDASKLADVSRRFFHTRAGYEATELLGTYQMEHGQPLAAALCFRRLIEAPAGAARFEPLLSVKLTVCCLRAGMISEAGDILNQLRKRDPSLTVAIAGEDQKLFSTGRSEPAWLAQSTTAPGDRLLGPSGWLMCRGSPARNAASAGGTPLLNRRWAVSCINDPRLEKLTEQVRESYVDQSIATLPDCQPLAVGDLIIARSVAGLVAIDFRTGKRIWRGPTDEAVKAVLDTQSVDRATADPSLLASWLDQRLLGDATYGTLSSDGRLVFCVEDVGTGLGADRMMTIIPANGRMRVQNSSGRSSNRLAAYEIASQGKLVWELPPDDRSDLAGAFFLGAPLPLDDRLYALIEIKGEIRLLALDSASGRVQWTQQLAVLEPGVVDTGVRHVAGLSPSYADGVLVCPTAAGAVVAVDLTTRSLVWGYQYPTAMQTNRMHFRGFPINNPIASSGGNDHWFDATLSLADGRVLLTPRDTPEEDDKHPELHCLDLADGKLLWKKPREDGMFVGVISKGKVLVVGRNSLRAYNLADGEPAWKADSVALPAGSLPSGRGFYSEGQYYLPLSTAEVVSVDLNTGRLAVRARSRSGEVAGNLLCYRGAVISQGATQIECFYQVDELKREVARRLQKDPVDPAALALQGELLLDEGQLGDSIARLRHSYGLAAQPRTRQLLVDALLEALARDFGAQRGAVPEIERLVDTPAERVRFLRALATGRQSLGELVPAFKTYMQIVNLGRPGEELDEIDRTLNCRRDRWVEARLAALRETALPADLAVMDRAIDERLKRATAEGTDGLRDFLAYFANHPLADEARELLLASLDSGAPAIDNGSLLERERLLRRLERSADPVRSRAATALLAKMFLDAGREEDAAGYYRRLAGPLADVKCLSGKTGRELVAELPPDAEIRQKLSDRDPWPTGLVRHEPLKGQPTPSFKSMPIEIRGPKGPYYARSSIELDMQQQSLIGRDGLGRERWRISLVDRSGDFSGRLNHGTNAISHARVDGHLMLVSLGTELVALDTIGTPGRQGPRVLWRHDLADTILSPVAIHGQPVNLPWNPRRFVATDNSRRTVGNTGPLTDSLACFQRQRTLVAVDPLTGHVLWTRSGIQPGSDVIGDEELLFVTAPGSQQALVLRSLDGSEVGRREVPTPDHRLAVLDRRVVVWEQTAGSQAVLKLRDVWENRDLWKYTFDSNAKPWPVDEEAVGVFDRQGHFVMISLADGKRTIDSHLTPEPALTEIFVFRTPTRDLLITSRPAQNRTNESIQPVPGGLGSATINGLVHGFDRHTGKHIYSTRIENMGLLLNQPADLPMLTFASQVQRASRLGQVSKALIKCLDKRTGRIIVDEQPAGPILSIEQSGDPERHQVILKTTRTSLRLTFTNEAWPTTKTDPAAAAGLPTRAGRTLLRGMQKWLEGQVPGADGPGPKP